MKGCFAPWLASPATLATQAAAPRPCFQYILVFINKYIIYTENFLKFFSAGVAAAKPANLFLVFIYIYIYLYIYIL